MNEKVKFWTKTIFWENVKKSIAVFSGPGIFAEFKLDAPEWLLWVTVAFTFAGALLAIWCTDNDKDGTVDLFQ